METYEIPDSVHARAFLMVYLPKEKILIQADVFSIRLQTNPLRPLPVASEIDLIDNLGRLQLNVENLLDEAYFPNANSNTNITPGSPRAVRLALMTRF